MIPEFIYRFAILTTLTIVLEGLGILLFVSLFGNTTPRRMPDFFVLAIALGLAFIILATLSLGALNIPPTKANFHILFSGICGGLLFLVFIKRLVFGSLIQLPLLKSENMLESIFIGVFLLLLILVRDIQVIGLYVPNWVDGLIHTSLLDKYVSTGKAIPLDGVYHNGFYAVALFIYYFWNVNLPDAVLLSGQWLSATCGLTFFLLVRKYIRHSYFVYFSLTIYSLFLLFPSYLVSWGRYPLLLGLTLLPPALLTSLSWLNGYKQNYLLAFLFLVALILAHYGSFLIWLSFILTYLVYDIFFRRSKKTGFKEWSRIFWRLILLVSPLLVFIIPKALNFISHPGILENMLLQDAKTEFANDSFLIFGLILDHDYFLVLFWIIGVILSLSFTRRLFWLIALWPLMFGVLTWIQYLFLGISISSYANIVIFISMPFAISIGSAFHILYSSKQFASSYKISDSATKSKRTLLLLLFLFIILGAFMNSRITNPDNVLFFTDDQLAMNWIKVYTPKDSVFLIRSFMWGNVLAPADGGGWINLLTRRSTVFPRLIGDYYDACGYIKDNNVNYIYLGKPQTNSDFDFDLSDLIDHYKIVYHRGGVTIVSVDCP